jgi:hypothetical protein
MTVEKLKACPLCGGTATLTASGLFDMRYSVQCDSCYSQSGASTNSDKVIALWNTRHEAAKAPATEQPDDYRCFDEWCASVKDCGHEVQPNSATARQRRLGWDAAMSLKRESSNPMLMAALKDAVHFIRNRHNMGRGVREERRRAVLANAQEVLAKIEEQGRRGS